MSLTRVDSTVTDSDIHAPTDSILLVDSVRVMVRLLRVAESRSGGILFFHDHHRRAKKRGREIIYTRGKDKKAQLYKDLVSVTRKTLDYVLGTASIGGVAQVLLSVSALA